MPICSPTCARSRPAATAPVAPARRALQAQATRRRQPVGLRKREATRLQQTARAEARADIKSPVTLLDRRIAKADRRMRDPPSIAALAVLAPIARDSGRRAGRRTIGGGDRSSGRGWTSPTFKRRVAMPPSAGGSKRRATGEGRDHRHRLQALGGPQCHARRRQRRSTRHHDPGVEARYPRKPAKTDGPGTVVAVDMWTRPRVVQAPAAGRSGISTAPPKTARATKKTLWTTVAGKPGAVQCRFASEGR